MSEYKHADIEQKWQKAWQKNKTFKTTGMRKGGKKVYCLDMFPYPSGAGLHMGHPLGYTATDIYSRYHRMAGNDVLHTMGWDAFGLPAEQHAIRTGEHPSNVTEANCNVFRGQLMKLGFSYDWDREIFTCRADYYKWTQWIFLQLYNSWFDPKVNKARPISELTIPQEVTQQGIKAVLAYQAEHRLAYYHEALVNFCPELGTVLANEEVIDGVSEVGGYPVIRKPMKQWMLRITKYADRLIDELADLDWPESIKEQQRNWIGRSEGTKIAFAVEGHNETLHAFTTRPDTLFGVTFVVVSPEHPLLTKLVPESHKNAVTNYQKEAAKLSDFQRTLETRSKTGAFSGVYLINPATGKNIPLYVADYVLANYGTGVVMGVPAHDGRDFEFARRYQLPIIPVIEPVGVAAEVRNAVVDGESCWTGEGKMLALNLPVFQKIGLVGVANIEAAAKITEWLVQNGCGEIVTTYKLRDWLFSRQRYWGEPIPIVHWEDGTMSALDEDQLPLLLPKVDDFKPSPDGQSPLAKAGDWLNVTCSKTGRKGTRETNTMPQWAGSCWYYLRFIDPTNSSAAWDRKLEKEWSPVDMYVGGAEHAVLHLLYARFWHKVLFDLGHVSRREPFQRLFNQGMILAHAFKDGRGVTIPVDEVEERDGTYIHKKTSEKVERIVAKMSKSLRNVVTPDEVISEYGADTLRLYLMFMGPLDSTRMWDTKAISGVNRFLFKIWNFVAGDKGFIVDSAEDVGIIRARHKLVKKVGEDIESFRFNTAIAAMMEFTNLLSGKQISRTTAETLVKLVSPFAPHIAEELWENIGTTASIAAVGWPSFDPAMLVDGAVSVVIQVNGKKRALLDVERDIIDSELEKSAVASLAGTQHAIKDCKKIIVVRNDQNGAPRLVNIIAG